MADNIYLLNIYGSARERKGGVSSDDLKEAINKLNHSALNLKTIEKAVAFCRVGKMPRGVWVMMGAGDVFKAGYRLLGRSN